MVNKEYLAEVFQYTATIYVTSYHRDAERSATSDFMRVVTDYINDMGKQGYSINHIKNPKIHCDYADTYNNIDYEGSIFILFERTPMAGAIYG